MKIERGVTLIELMVALIVLGIIAGVAFPNFQNLVRDNRTTTHTNELVTAINLARSEAVRRGGTVTVAPVGGSFAGGICVFTGANCAGNAIVRQFPEMRNIEINNGAVTLVFDGRGAKTAPAGPQTLLIYPQDCPSGSERGRQLRVSNAGHVSVERVGCPG
ncbi:MAG: GspH/FimT family pseudopilin [Ectothiorhodospiraceae bacterium]|nr:GspH/FimT family pseudopilin [Ectothiorhodospiraceae bacterium]